MPSLTCSTSISRRSLLPTWTVWPALRIAPTTGAPVAVKLADAVYWADGLVSRSVPAAVVSGMV